MDLGRESSCEGHVACSKKRVDPQSVPRMHLTLCSGREAEKLRQKNRGLTEGGGPETGVGCSLRVW